MISNKLKVSAMYSDVRSRVEEPTNSRFVKGTGGRLIEIFACGLVAKAPNARSDETLKYMSRGLQNDQQPKSLMSSLSAREKRTCQMSTDSVGKGTSARCRSDIPCQYPGAALKSSAVIRGDGRKRASSDLYIMSARTVGLCTETAMMADSLCSLHHIPHRC